MLTANKVLNGPVAEADRFINGKFYTAAEEGYSLSAYPDPITKAEPWTIGRGHTGADVKRGDVWTPGRIETAFVIDYADATHGAIWAFPRFRRLSYWRQCVLIDMAFELGPHGLAAFKSFLTLMSDAVTTADDKLFTRAAADLKGSAYYHEVTKRAALNVGLIERGTI